MGLGSVGLCYPADELVEAVHELLLVDYTVTIGIEDEKELVDLRHGAIPSQVDQIETGW